MDRGGNVPGGDPVVPRRLLAAAGTTGIGGLIAEYLAYSQAGPGHHRWLNWPIRGPPRAGPSGLICRVHPAGTGAHQARQAALARAGWRLHDAYASRWGGDAVRAALELHAALRGHDRAGTGAQRKPGIDVGQ